MVYWETGAGGSGDEEEALALLSGGGNSDACGEGASSAEREALARKAGRLLEKFAAAAAQADRGGAQKV